MPSPDRGADAEEAIRALIGAYAERLDAGDLDGAAALFEHGGFRSARGGPALTGAPAVRRMYDPVILYDDGTPRTKHVLGNVVVDVDDAAGSARATCTFTVLQAAPDAPLRSVLCGPRSQAQDSSRRITCRACGQLLAGICFDAPRLIDSPSD